MPNRGKPHLPTPMEIKHSREGYTPSWKATRFAERLKKVDPLVEEAKSEELEGTPDFLEFADVTIHPPERMGEKLVEQKLKEFRRIHQNTGVLEVQKLQKSRGGKVRESEWWKYAKKTKIPNCRRLRKTFVKLQKRRTCCKVQKSRIESNAITRLRRCCTLMEANRSRNFKTLARDTVLISIGIYASTQSSLTGKKLREVLFDSTTTLTEVRKWIQCLDDENKVSGSSFLIDGTFYTDGYQENSATDAPQIIQNWVRLDNRYLEPQIDAYQQKPMKGVRLCDLPLRLGAHYLYLHQSNCLHPIIISDIRQIHPTKDVKNENAYPLMTFEMVHRIQLCGVCGKRPADLVTYNDILTPTSPFFFCRDCFVGFHFDKENKLIYKNFQVYHYKYD